MPQPRLPRGLVAVDQPPAAPARPDRWWWPGLRLLIVAAAIWLAGRSCATSVNEPAMGRVAAWPCLVAGFLAVTALAIVRLAVPRMRGQLRVPAVQVGLLCSMLFALQTIETASHDHSESLAGRAIMFLADGSRSVDQALRHYSRWHKNLWPWLVVQVAAYLAISRLWRAGAYEIAIGSALFWVWVVAYFFLNMRPPGHVGFWGQFFE